MSGQVVSILIPCGIEEPQGAEENRDGEKAEEQDPDQVNCEGGVGEHTPYIAEVNWKHDRWGREG